MKKKVSHAGVLFCFYTILALFPSYFKNSLVYDLEYFFMMLSILFLILNKYKPSNFTLIAIIYYGFLFALSGFNRTSTFGLGLAVSHLRIVIYLMSMENMLRIHKKQTAINIIYSILFVYVLIDYLSLILYPEGLYFTEVVWNEWYTGRTPNWFLGVKNARWFFYILLMVVSYWKSYIDSNRHMKMIMVILFIISESAAIIEKSSTSLVVIGLGCIGIFYMCLRRKPVNFRINVKWMLMAYSVFLFVIVSGSSSFLRPIIEGLLNKDMTFSDRTTVWTNVIPLIIRKPIFGWGDVGYAQARYLLGSWTYNHAHNQWLNILWQGGVCLLFIFLLLIFKITRSINHIRNNRIVLGCALIFLSVLINMIFEVPMNYLGVWILLYVILRLSMELKNVE